MFNFSEGKLEKLKIMAYSDPDFKVSVGSYTVLVNPEKYSEKYEVQFDETQPIGAKEAELKFQKTLPQQLDLNFIFDSTGILSQRSSFGTNLFSNTTTESVPNQIKRFKEVAFDYHGEKHQPRYLKLIWGEKDTDEVFSGRMTSLTITYTLFKRDGTAIRATADATFKKSVSKQNEAASKSASSPDLTHVRIVKEGDTLPLMTYRIYGDSKYFLEVARVNNITNIRRLEVGRKIAFPPLDKTIA